MMALALMGVAAGVGVSLLQRGSTAVTLAAQESAKVEVNAEVSKVLAIAGFLVSNGIVACKEPGWESGGAPKTCRYEGGKRRDADFKLSTFGLSNPRNKAGGKPILIFDLDPQTIVSKSSTIRVTAASLTFELVDATKEENLKALLGERSRVLEAIDKDNHLVVATTALTYTKEKREYTTSGSAAFKRPIAMTRVSVSTGSACAGRCNSSVSQNPYPSCRGPQTVSDEAVVEIIGTTTNLGPGLLYDLAYEKSLCLKNNLSDVIGANGENCSKQSLSARDATIRIPIQDYLAPDKSIRWTDTAPCKAFVETTNLSGGASAGGGSTVVGQAVQHVTEAGRITYQIDATSNKSRIEPFRLNEPVDRSTGKLPGRLNVIYVVPTH
jgi:hypothetical protein